jgi:hypothetical protein
MAFLSNGARAVASGQVKNISALLVIVFDGVRRVSGRPRLKTQRAAGAVAALQAPREEFGEVI